MKKYAVVTISIGEDYKKMRKVTHLSINAYAEKIGADFICIDKQKISITTPHWEKFQIFNLLNKYERILYLDTDLIVREDCPDLFDIVPKNKLGAFNEASYTERSKELLIDICKEYGVTLPSWNGHYYNSGVLVISRCHKYLFKKPDKEVFNFYEQSYLNMKIVQENIDIFPLPYKFNRMTCLDKFTGEDRFASYIIHYAGYPNLQWVLNLIPQDIARWKQDKGNYQYKKHVYISVNGGLGDQIQAEPAIRFMKEQVYPNADIQIATHWPRIFQHLNLPTFEHGKFQPNGDTPYYLVSSLPGPETVQWSIVSNLLCHTIDYCSMALLRRILPNKDKQVKLKVNLSDIANLVDIVGIQKLDDLVVVHAGRHWQAKSLPKKWWQAVVDGLANKGLKVCLIGKDEDLRGVWDIDCPKKGIDTRNLLDVGSLFALISSAKLLITNDSAPLHIAGAFCNWVITIPFKHPDHILPWRNGRQDYKAVALHKRLPLDDIDSQPTSVDGVSGANLARGWEEYLPEVGGVVKTAIEVAG